MANGFEIIDNASKNIEKGNTREAQSQLDMLDPSNTQLALNIMGDRCANPSSLSSLPKCEIVETNGNVEEITFTGDHPATVSQKDGRLKVESSSGLDRLGDSIGEAYDSAKKFVGGTIDSALSIPAAIGDALKTSGTEDGWHAKVTRQREDKAAGVK